MSSDEKSPPLAAAVQFHNSDGGSTESVPTVLGGSAPSFMHEFDQHQTIGSTPGTTPMQRRPPCPCFDGVRERISDFWEVIIDFFTQTVTLTYTIIFITAVAVALLLLIVGLAAGLGPMDRHLKTASYTSLETSDDEHADPVIPYDRNKPWTYYRLPKNIAPKHYAIDLDPHFYGDDEKTFDGNVTIQANVAIATRLIILHVLDLNFSSTSVSYLTDDGKVAATAEPGIRKTFSFQPYQYFVIELKQRLKKNSTIQIKLTFSGYLNSDSEGFYKSFFRHPQTGEKLYVAMTMFEPLDARRAFPCFDEPHFKSYFTISLRHKLQYKALSNMPVDTATPDLNDKGMVVTRFQRTNVPMSTYLVAFIVGQYASLPSVTTTVAKVPITIYAPEYAVEMTRYSLDVTAKILDWMQNFFIVPYPLPKVDLIVLPSFRWTAMENWGLITFREDALLVSDETSEADRDLVVAVIAHELAHQWFGNLVTMEWWDDLWLNEGFASYMEFPASIAVGRLIDSEEYHDYIGVIGDDAFRSSRPIRFLEIRGRNDIGSAFDSITYKKGSTIIRMLVNSIGPEKFKNAIQDYMSTYQYKNARTKDLWDSLGRHYSNVDISKVMTTWVEQKGVPLVTVALAPRNDELVLRQEPFVIPQWNPDGRPPLDSVLPEVTRRRWWIPVRQQGSSETSWIPPDSANFTLRLPGQQAAENKINLNQTAYLRVNYPTVMWEKLGEKLARDINAFEPIDRAGLVDDCLELAKAGLVKYETAFKTVSFMRKETHPLVWETFVSQANFLNHMLWDSPQYLQFKAWIGGAIRSARMFALNNVQQSQQNPSFKRILSILAEASLNLDPGTDAKCYADTYYREWELPKNRELRRAIFTAFLQSNDTEAGMAELLGLSSRTPLKQIQRQIKYAIGRSKQFSLLSRELGKLFKDEMNPNEFLQLATYATNSDLHRSFMWDWARDNFEKLKPHFGGPTIKFMSWFVNIAKYFNTPTKYNEFDTFARTVVRNFGDGLRARRLIEDQIRRNIYWRDNLKQQLEKYLAALKLPSLTPSTVC